MVMGPVSGEYVAQMSRSKGWEAAGWQVVFSGGGDGSAVPTWHFYIKTKMIF